MSDQMARSCDGCTECCKGYVFGEAHGKKFYAGRPCHFMAEKGCGIYEARPDFPCRVFQCGWLTDYEMFPEWLKPNVSKVLAQKHTTKTDIEFYKIHECGQKIDAEVLNYLILHSLNNSVNISIQVAGGWSNYGTKDFVKEMMQLGQPQ